MQSKEPVTSYWQYSVFKIVLMALAIVGLMNTIVTVWLLSAFRSSAAEVAAGQSILGFAPETINFLLPILWQSLILSPILATMLWAGSLALRAPKQEIDEEVRNRSIERVASEQVQKLVDKTYNDIAEALKIVRVIGDIRKDWPKLSQEVAEASALLATTLGTELGPLKDRLDKLAYDSRHAVRFGQEQLETIKAVVTEFAAIRDEVHRAIALHDTNEKTLTELLTNIDALRIKVAGLNSPPAIESNVVQATFPTQTPAE